ncbi:hypothetical protein GGS24DRAFT_361425 [Hypoxylon argillaceum]|nr:hypothetical protein GGS24DRAFT_361425 [Hypoxylon argillaceum]KAI1150349.1 hypothetical protein F4825DRAFT_17155 [Nemania diffusa]
MLILSRHSQNQTATQPAGAHPKAIANKQTYGNTSHLNMDVPKALGMPTACPNPPRPPTPGPPRPNPPVPPQPPAPTPPPSPHQIPSYGLGLGPQLPILVSRAEPFQCPYPNPPPSPGPGPRRPPPIQPRPYVPSPPPSPRRSINPWVFSTASSLVIFVLEYLSSTTWDAGTVYEYVRSAAEDGTWSKWHSDNPLAKEPIALPELLKSHCQQVNSEMPRCLGVRREVC